MANLSAELPDSRKFFGYRFFQDTSVVCESEDEAIAALCFPPFPTNPPIPVVYLSNAASCTVECPDGSIVSYTVVPASAAALSQAAADARAEALACQIAQILCTGLMPTLYQSAAQTCSHTCVDGTIVSYTAEAGTFLALSQAEADQLAATFACDLAALLCPEPPSDAGALGGAGSEPDAPYKPKFANRPMSANALCPDGSTYTFTARAGLFIRDTPAEANEVALSYAQRQADLRKTCLSDLSTELCANVFHSDLIVALGLVGEVVWSITAGAIPDGMTFEEGQLAGFPSTAGAYTFTVQATDSAGSTVARSYTVDVIAISPSSLPGGSVGTAYSQQLSQTGGAEPATWGITAGALPPGLVLDPETGIISGTPTTQGTFAFTVSVITV